VASQRFRVEIEFVWVEVNRMAEAFAVAVDTGYDDLRFFLPGLNAVA